MLHYASLRLHETNCGEQEDSTMKNFYQKKTWQKNMPFWVASLPFALLLYRNCWPWCTLRKARRFPTSCWALWCFALSCLLSLFRGFCPTPKVMCGRFFGILFSIPESATHHFVMPKKHSRLFRLCLASGNIHFPPPHWCFASDAGERPFVVIERNIAPEWSGQIAYADIVEAVDFFHL